MKSVDFLIVGGSAAGTTAAELIKGIKVIKLDSGGHGVDLSNGEQIGYKKLLIAIGGDVNRLNIAGSDLANILYLRTIKDADSVIEAAKKSKKGLVLGGGFVSLDFATGFRVNGVEKVVILTRDPYFWSGHLDPESGRLMKNLLLKNGVEIMTGEEADSFFGQDNVEGAVTKSGKNLEAGVAGVGIGIKSDLEWLKKAGIKTHRAILTNEYLETNMADVYAA